MKITTQRSLLWTLNFVIVFAVIGCAMMMGKKSGKYRGKDLALYQREVDEALDVKVRPESASEAEQTRAQFTTPLSRDFHFEGFVPEPEKKPEVKTEVKEQAPKLESLIAVEMVLAPVAASGPIEDNLGTASIRILSPSKNGKPGSAPGADGRVYAYTVGDVIGIEMYRRDDSDPQLLKWGPCRLVAVKNSAIVCSWNKGTEEVEVKIDLSPPGDAEVYITQGEKTLFGSEAALHGREEVKGGGFRSTDKLTRTTLVNDTTIVQWEPAGLRALQDEGEKILDDIEVKSAAGGKGLTIVSLPKRLGEFGLQDGDIIIELDGQAVESKAMATNYVRKTYRKKSHYNVVVLRDGRTRNLQIDVPRKLSDANRDVRNVRFGK